MNPNYTNGLPARMKMFFSYQAAVKNKSELTIDEYCIDLRMFFKYLFRMQTNRTCELNDIDISGLDDDFFRSVTLEDAYQFLSYCKTERDNQEKARARKVSAIRSFFSYLEKNNVIRDNPMIHLDAPKLKKSLPKYLSVDDAKRLLRCIDGKNRERDYCIITLFLNCGMRLSELVSLDYNKIKINGDEATVVITGKGNKERTIYLNHACVAAINSYMRVRPKNGVIDPYALFLSNRLTRISPKTVQHMVDVYLEKAGLGDQGFSVHKLRHTAATLMYQTGKVDVLELKEILGHENLNTTQIYTHIFKESLKKATEANPLSDFRPDPSNQSAEVAQQDDQQ